MFRNSGLPCNSTERLVSGSSFTIASKTCQNGNYPKKERCAWYFEVDGCKPSLKCEKMVIKGKGKRCLNICIFMHNLFFGFHFRCKGDRLKVETENRRKAFCRKNQIRKGFTDAKRNCNSS